MSYTYTKEENNNELVKEGDYEVIIENMQIKETPTNHTEYLSIQYRVRSDVEQAYKNKCLFESLWHPKDDKNVFNPKRINKILNTQNNIQEGQVFDSIDDVINFLTGAKLSLHVKITFNEYRGADENTIAYYNATKFPTQTLGSNYKKDAPNTGTVVEDDDLPF